MTTGIQLLLLSIVYIRKFRIQFFLHYALKVNYISQNAKLQKKEGKNNVKW